MQENVYAVTLTAPEILEGADKITRGDNAHLAM